MVEIVFISPYRALTDTVNQVIEEYQIENMKVLEGNLNEGLQLAKSAVSNGATIIISRGGTYQLLKKHLHTIVLELKLTIFDIAQSISEMLRPAEKIAIIGYDNMIQAYKLLEILNHDRIKIVQLRDPDKVNQKIQECIDEGIQFFMGDAIVTEYCQKMGVNCWTIGSSRESVKMVIDDAQSVLEGQRKESEFNKRYTALMDSVHDGFIATDENDQIIACNKMAEQILKIDKKQVVGKSIVKLSSLQDFLTIYTANHAVNEELVKVRGKDIAVSHVPIKVQQVRKGSVLIFQEVAQLQKFENKIRKKVLGSGFSAKYQLSDIIYQSHGMTQCIKRAEKYGLYDAPVLIEGDTGVGKELFAQGIHNVGNRKNEPFVAVNCAALPETLIESELFGYDEGAFTGSRKGGRPGMFELAHNGTIFLDEISELPLLAQGRLLRVLQEQQIVRVGGTEMIPIDVRVICATNRRLVEEVEKGNFREDLLYRINILTLEIPSLNQRREEIPKLIEFYLATYRQKYGKPQLLFSPAAVQCLQEYDYQGNVRELEGIIERAVILSDDQQVNEEDLLLKSSKVQIEAKVQALFTALPTLQELEQGYIGFVEEKFNTATEVSKVLGINRSTLYRKKQQ